jgi:excisionase family DNA binding protein
LSERYYSTGKAARLLRIHKITLFRWIKAGRVRAERTPANRWLVPQSEIDRLLGVKTEIPEPRAVLYARVSSHDQKEHLESQLNRLARFAQERSYHVVKAYGEVASGLSENRHKLHQALKRIERREADVLLVEFKDRLTRFGFNYLARLIESYGGRVEVVESDVKKDAMQELVEDMISVVTSFCAKLYGVRSRKFKKVKEAVKTAVHG